MDYLSEISTKDNFRSIERLDKKQNNIARKICNLNESGAHYTHTYSVTLYFLEDNNLLYVDK